MKYTESQSLALNSEGNVLVEAGAGSGKTFIFAHRYIHMLTTHTQWNPSQVLAITFTNLAAAELTHRIHETLSTLHMTSILSQMHLAHIDTIHGFCSRLIRRYPIEAGVDPDFSVLDPLHQQLLVETVAKQTLSQLAHAKNDALKLLRRHYAHAYLISLLCEFLIHGKAPNFDLSGLPEAFSFISQEAFTAYQQEKQTLGVLDYDDLIEHAMSVVQHPRCTQTLQQQFKCIMVDEFQDTDPKQWALIQLLCDSYNPLSARKLFLVGDMKQSIYGFRGADSQLFLDTLSDISSDPSSGHVVKMADNFRTQSPILEWVNALFSPLFEPSSVPYTPLSAFREDCDGSVRLGLWPESFSFEDECQALGTYLKQHLKERDVLFRNCAVLVRTNKQVEQVKKAFQALGLPSRSHTQKGYFQHEAIVDIFHLVLCLKSPHQSLGWIRLLRAPYIGLSEQEITAIHNHPSMGSFYSAMRESLDPELVSRIDSWFSLLLTRPLSDLIEDILYDMGALMFFKSLGDDAIEKVSLFISEIRQLEQDVLVSDQQLIQRLHQLIYTSQSVTLPAKDEDAIQVMTIHTSKGLEFDVVALAGIQTSFRSSSDLEEEVRLFYVACTRARDSLFLSGIYDPSSLSIESPRSFMDFLLSQGDLENNVFSFSQSSMSTPVIHQPPGLDPGDIGPLFSAASTAPEVPEMTPLTVYPDHPPAVSRMSVSAVSAALQPQEIVAPNTDALSPSQASDLGVRIHQALFKTLTHASYQVASSDLQSHLARFKQSSLYQRLSTNDPYLEKAFCYSFDQFVIEGRFDAAFCEGGQWTCVDFKTNVVSDQNFDQHASRYKISLMLYALALSVLVQCSPEDIKAVIYYTRYDREVYFSFSSLDFDGLKRQVLGVL